MFRQIMAGLVCLTSLACSAPAGKPFTPIEGADQIAFRCVLDQEGVNLEGAPLENCGCLTPKSDDPRDGFNALPRLLCTCIGADGQYVEYVEGSCSGDVCTPTVENGDYTPWSGVGDQAPCVPRGGGEIRGYISSTIQGEITPIRIERAPGRRGPSNKDVVDVDPTIPGLNGIYINDIVTDLVADPLGRFLITVNSSSGNLSLIKSDDTVREATRFELNLGPLHGAFVWPDPSQFPRLADSGQAPRRLYVTAPGARALAVLDLDRLADLVELGREDTDDPLVDCFGLAPDSPCGWLGDGTASGGIPGLVRSDSAGQFLLVGYMDKLVVSVFNRSDGSDYNEFELQAEHACGDSYIAPWLKFSETDGSCEDDLDNNSDGLIDDEDDKCRRGLNEADQCSIVAPCADGIDNDNDGDIDGDDSDCALGFWERPVLPACDDGIDNDGDGHIDRADSGCLHMGDRSEGERETGPACDNGLDDDGDGLVDNDDPGCRYEDSQRRYNGEATAQCGDGIDNDNDGLVDFGPQGDDGCLSASDPEEGDPDLPAAIEFLEMLDVSTPTDTIVIAYAGATGTPLHALEVSANPMQLRPIFGRDDTVAISPRQRLGAAELLVADASGQISSMTAADYLPMEYGVSGQPVFGRFPDLAYDEPSSWARVSAGLGVFLNGLYVVVDGRALGIEQGSQLCSPIACQGETDCADWGECVSGICIPRACSESAECGTATCSQDGVCVQPCLGSDECEGELICGEALDGVGGQTCQSECSRSKTGTILTGALEETELTLAPQGADEVFSLRNQGSEDLALAHRTRFALSHGEANRLVSAFALTPRLDAEPILTVRGARKRLDVNRYPFFCDTMLTDPELSESECIPTGYTLGDDGLVALEDTLDGVSEDNEVLESEWVSSVGAVTIKEGARELGAETFTVAYEGTLPNSASTTGHYGSAEDASHWKLLDFRTDFCALGVEINDIVIVERFSPEIEAAERCEIFEGDEEAFSSTPLRERLRYSVEAVTPHGLTLRPDERTSYAQRPRSPFVSLPRLAPPLPSPQAECVSRPIEYRVRVGHDQWAVVGQELGFAHPWISDGDVCVQDPSKSDLRGRARLGETFENRWMNFRLGFTADDSLCNHDGPCGPFMVDVVYGFSLASTTSFNRFEGALGLPRAMRWLPTSDRLFIVDSGLETVVEIGGLDPFLESMFEVTRYR